MRVYAAYYLYIYTLYIHIKHIIYIKIYITKATPRCHFSSIQAQSKIMFGSAWPMETLPQTVSATEPDSSGRTTHFLCHSFTEEKWGWQALTLNPQTIVLAWGRQGPENLTTTISSRESIDSWQPIAQQPLTDQDSKLLMHLSAHQLFQIVRTIVNRTPGVHSCEVPVNLLCALLASLSRMPGRLHLTNFCDQNK